MALSEHIFWLCVCVLKGDRLLVALLNRDIMTTSLPDAQRKEARVLSSAIYSQHEIYQHDFATTSVANGFKCVAVTPRFILNIPKAKHFHKNLATEIIIKHTAQHSDAYNLISPTYSLKQF